MKRELKSIITNASFLVIFNVIELWVLSIDTSSRGLD